MQTLSDITALRAALTDWRRADERIALAPTMGNLHAGHLQLAARAKTLAGRVVVSLFVNPMQFDRADDLAAYPRTFKEDQRKLAQLRVDLLFAPEAAAIYPKATAQMTRVEVPGLSDILEGAARPGHFTGVATVVTKLFNLVQPDVAVFGEKDYQQLLIIRRLTEDLNLPVDVQAVPTVRESGGLALSSRNSYLSAGEHRRAGDLYKILRELAQAVRDGERDYPRLQARALRRLEAQGFRPDYVSIRRAQDLVEPQPGESDLVVLGAAWLGQTRLIDNLRIASDE